MDFRFGIDKLNLANLVGEVMDKIVEFLSSENDIDTKRSNSMVFGFEKIMDIALDIDKLNLANLMGKVVDKIMEYQIFLPKCTEKIKASIFQKTSTKIHISR